MHEKFKRREIGEIGFRTPAGKGRWRRRLASKQARDHGTNVAGVWFCRSSAAIANPGNVLLKNNPIEPREPRTAAATIKVFFYCCEVLLKSFCVVVRSVNRKEGRTSYRHITTAQGLVMSSQICSQRRCLQQPYNCNRISWMWWAIPFELLGDSANRISLMRAQGMTHRVDSRYYIQQPLHLEGLEFCLQWFLAASCRISQCTCNSAVLEIGWFTFIKKRRIPGNLISFIGVHSSSCVRKMWNTAHHFCCPALYQGLCNQAQFSSTIVWRINSQFADQTHPQRIPQKWMGNHSKVA